MNNLAGSCEVSKAVTFCHSGLPVPDVWVSGIFSKKDSRHALLAGMTVNSHPDAEYRGTLLIKSKLWGYWVQHQDSEAFFRSLSKDCVSSLILHPGKMNFMFSMVIPLKVSVLSTCTRSSVLWKINTCLAKIPYFEPLHTTRSYGTTSSIKDSNFTGNTKGRREQLNVSPF